MVSDLSVGVNHHSRFARDAARESDREQDAAAPPRAWDRGRRGLRAVAPLRRGGAVDGLGLGAATVPVPAANPRSTPTSPWIEAADDGTCPAQYPVKAKLASGIYHLPGGANYARTQADRCYRSAAAAEAAGLRASKR